MSGSRARKVQPFTITTKLSLPKCSLDFSGDSCPDIAALDNHALHQNLNERVSLYLAQASPVSSEGRFDSTSPVEEVATNEDRINRNSLSRSIKKITLSNWHGEPNPGEETSTHTRCERNCNNNNCRTGKAQFKVFLRKEVEIEEEKQDSRRPQASGHSSLGRVAPLHMMSSCAVAGPWKENVKNIQAGKVAGLKPCLQNSPGLADLSKWSPHIAQFNCDMMQAEKWVRAKLRDLKDGCSIQEWERAAQTLQRDMKDFENTMIKLNQMGDQLTIQSNSSAEIARRLQTLCEQWQLLKQMAANQSKAVSGLRNLQEFNQKAEQLEAWIRQKEEKPLLTALLQENADKIQLTRRILDLKQEEQQFQALHEEMNSLAHKLEKQGKSESRSIMARRKHLNKMWLRLQGTLKEHHETLQLALEAAAFVQQAEVLLGAIHAKRRNLCGVGKQREPETSPDLDVRDIASQVMMLDVTVSQLTSLHPSLVARVSLKHQDVKESWAQLQQLLRRSIDSPNREQVKIMSNSAGREAGGKPVWEIWKDIQGNQEGNTDSPGKEAITSDSRRRRKKLLWHSNALKDLPQQEAHLQDFCQVADGELHRWSPQMEDALEELEDLWEELRRRHQENGVALREIDTALRLVGEVEEAECWLETVLGLLSEPEAAAAKNLDDLHGDLEKVGTLENQVEAWHIKLQALQEEMKMDSSSEHTAAAMIHRKMERVKEKFACVQEALQRRTSDLKDALVLTEFLQNVHMEEMLSHRNQVQAVPNQLGSQEPLQLLIAQSAQQLSNEDMNRSLVELQEAVDMLNSVVKERERAMEAVTKTENLKCFVQALSSGEETKLAWVTSRIKTMRNRAETLAQDIMQAERSFATVKSEADLLELQRLMERQKEIESEMSSLEGDMEKLERAFMELEDCCLIEMPNESRRISETLEAWKDLQKLVLGNAVHAQQAAHLRQFFRAYLAIISWTEDTRAQIFSETMSTHGLSEAQWEDLESNMETKFKEFEELAAVGWKLVAEEHSLSETIKERMEELQSMLGWVMVRWRAQSSQKDPGSKSDGRETQNGTLNMTEHCQIKVVPESGVGEANGILNSSVSERPPLTLGSLPNGSATQQESESVSTAVLSTLDVLPGHRQSLEELENHLPFEMDVPKETLILEPLETPVLLVPQPGPGSLGGTVNLILSIGKKAGREATGSQVGAAPSMGPETLHKLSETKSSACKAFWKRCQGLLGSTLGSLKRKKRPPRQHAEEVSTYLHVKEKEGDRDAGIVCGSSTMLRPAKQMPPGAHSSSFPSPAWGTSAFHTLPKISSSCFLRSLKRKGRVEAEDAQQLTLQGIMGTEPSDLQAGQGERRSTSSTWPPKGNRRAQALQTECPAPCRELTDYVKNPLARAIDAECDLVREVSGCHVFPRESRGLNSPPSLAERMSNTCQHLSLGSVLSLELPKDPTVLRNIHDTIRVAKEGAAGRKGISQVCQGARSSPAGAKVPEVGSSLQKRVLGGQPVMHQRPLRPEDARDKLPQGKGGTWFEEMSINPSYSRQKACFVALCGEDRQSPNSQSSPSDDFLDFKQNRLSRISVLHEQIGIEWDRLATSLGTTGSSKEAQVKGPADHKAREASRVKLKPSPAKHMSSSDAVSSIAKAKNPAVNGAEEKGSCVRTSPSFLHLGVKSPAKLSVFECELGTPTPSGLDPLVPAPGGSTTKGPKLLEACHPAHELFEEEEEELQAIWSNVEKHKKSSGIHSSPAGKVDKMQSPDSSGARLLLAAADNLLVAKFKLPTSAQLLQRSEGERGTSCDSPSRCRAPMPSVQEPSEGAVAAAVRSLQSTCPGAQQKLQAEGRSIGKNLPSKLELQMMEGALERKHLLQAGGKKANCRSWNTFHTVLMRQTLCFYQDKKDTLKSSVVALPLNLRGAVCTLETEYIKKNNCFTLQLKDGSKYLLRAPTEPLMQEWITKLQQNSGLPEVDFFQSASQTAQETTSAVSHRVPHFLGPHQSLTAKSQEAILLPRSSLRLQLPYENQDDLLDSAESQTEDSQKSAAIYTTDHSLRQNSPTASTRSQEPYIFEEEDYGLVANKRRSYSFTSATYQKITPLSVSKEPLGLGSSYSVTLYIGEQGPTPPRPRCHSFIASPGGARETLGERSQGASPRQKNKSVFRKFFGKKD
ncbi:uncharacterized protein LOC128410983 isoform X2 [Podarcis raffonei]|uniref:uncharacterized protein LOC128410983 isoform X2 n=1 Tax=Podarcis raffonei TaxID=65483 RepID=UPI0023292AA0|nr:uncharacterized protein LOC128410983 isoform X2 [Podarcis raffonei]